MMAKTLSRALKIMVIVSLLWPAPPRALAAGVVGTGTPASCTEAALEAALAGGGNVTFNCGAAPHTILSSIAKSITMDTTIDGGGLITLDGQDGDRLFLVSDGAVLTLRNIELAHGFSGGDGGAIYNGALGADIPGSVILENSTIRDSVAGQSGGAIVTTGPLTITNSLLEGNSALNGGAVYPRFAAARTTIINSILRYNTATDATNGWGGAILMWDGAPVTIAGGEIFSNTARMGGGIYVFANSTLTLSGGVLRDNLATTGGGVYNDGTATVTDGILSDNTAIHTGGGMFNSGLLWQTGVMISGNTAGNGAGGLYNEYIATLTNVTLSGNSADYGGGLINFTGSTAILTNVTLSGNEAQSSSVGGLHNLGTAILTNVTLSGNTAAQSAGGLYNGGIATLTNVTLSGNTAGSAGGGFVNFTGTATLTNVTFSGNIAGVEGGGLHNIGTATLTNITFSGNEALSGGGIYNFNGYTVTLKNSILAYSPIGGNCGGAPLTSDKYTLSSDNTCALGGPGSQNNVEPLLTELGNYGGLTQVHMLKLGSPAIDGVLGSDAPGTDQRGQPRPQGGGYDIGAVERQPTDSDLAPQVYLPLVIR